MKINELLDRIKALNLKLPEQGTGKNGRIVAADLVRTLGEHYAATKYTTTAERKHLELRVKAEPMKSYRFNKLNKTYQDAIFNDDNNWVLEEKFNGWRMMITWVPGDGYRFWGGNTSTVDFLPVDYTDHMIKSDMMQLDRLHDEPVLIDTEVLCYDNVEMLDGRTSTNTLDAVKAILGSDVERAMKLQAQHTLVFKCFDCLFVKDGKLELSVNYALRHLMLTNAVRHLDSDRFTCPPVVSMEKRQFLQNIWINGGEGVIAKNVFASYAPGSRRKEISVKIKRTMSGEVGDDIDAFIIGYSLTDEWTKKGLIGAIKLGVYIKGTETVHHVATVSAMPDEVRKKLTDDGQHFGQGPCLNDEYINRVLTVDGQELSARNNMIMHAVVDWDRGFRDDKSPDQCTLSLDMYDNERF